MKPTGALRREVCPSSLRLFHSLTFDCVNEGVHVDPTIWNRRQPLHLRDKRDELFFVFWVTIGFPHVAPAQTRCRSLGVGRDSECQKTELYIHERHLSTEAATTTTTTTAAATTTITVFRVLVVAPSGLFIQKKYNVLPPLPVGQISGSFTVVQNRWLTYRFTYRSFSHRLTMRWFTYRLTKRWFTYRLAKRWFTYRLKNRWITYRLTNRWFSSTSRTLSSEENLQQNVNRTGTRFLSLFTPRISSTTFQQLSNNVSGSGTTCSIHLAQGEAGGFWVLGSYNTIGI